LAALPSGRQPREFLIFRSIDLPAEVDASKVTATLKDGVLELSMPKTPKARKIKVEEKPD